MRTKTSMCPKCKSPLPRDAPKGLCPECLMLVGFADDDATVARPSPDGTNERTVHIVVPLDESVGVVPETLRDFGDYELLEQIATGGMGVVFKARQVSLNRLVAVKMIRGGQLAREPDIARFRTEAQAAANLKHPHIVTIHEVGEHEGRHFFSMDFIEGRSLATLVRAHPLEPARAARLIQTVAEAIAYAHERGVLHRDLKPSNVMIDAQDQPHVTDFGLAKLLKSDSELTQTGAVMGSPSYMSPEQAQGRSDQVSIRSDVYALGAMLYELLTTRPPFLAATALETMKLVAEREPVAPRILTPAVPRDLETICLKCLQKEPAHRYAGAQELAEELGRFLRGEPICARPIAKWEHGVKWAKRHPARAGLVVLTLIVPAVIITVLLVMGAKVSRERNLALQQEQKAIGAQTRAEAGELAARERAYAADIYAAFQALAVDDLAQARRLLNEYRPVRNTNEASRLTNGLSSPMTGSSRGNTAQTSGDQSLLTSAATPADLRGFEWRVLWERTRGQEAFAFTNLARPAECLVFAPDGRTLISGGDDGIHLWDIVERRSLGMFPGPDPGPTSGDLAPTVEELRPMLEASPAVVEHLKAQPGILNYLDALGHTNRTRSVKSLAFTPNGRHLLVGSGDFVRSWDFATRAFDFAVPEADATVAAPTVGDFFVVANNQQVEPDDERRTAHPQSALLYSFTQRRLVAELPGYGLRAVVSPDGQSVAAASQTNGAVLWHPSTGEAVPIHHDPQFSGLLSFSPDGRTLLVRSDGNRQPMLWDVKSKRIKAYLRGDRLHLGTMAWSPDGRSLAGGGANQNIGIWLVPPEEAPDDPQAGPPFLLPRTILHGHEATVTALTFSPDGGWLASAAEDHSLRLWAVARSPTAAPDPAPPARPDHQSMYELTMDPVTGCAVGRSCGELAVWNPQHGYTPRSLPGTKRHLPAGFLAAGRGFVTVEMTTNGVPVWLEIRRLPEGIVQTRREIPPAPGEMRSRGSGGLTSLAASPDGQWLAVPQTSVERLPDVHVFAIATGGFVARLAGEHPASLINLRASPDNRWLVHLTHYHGENRITIYDARSWRRAREMAFRSSSNDVVGAAIDPASRFLVTGGPGENSLRVWDLLTGRLAGQCNGNVIGWHPVWSRDGRTLAVRDTGSLRLWSMVVFRELAALPVDWHNTHLPLGFTADGRALVTLGLEGRVNAWSPPTLAEIDRAP